METDSDDYYSPGTQKRHNEERRYNKTRHLIRWNPLLEERLIVAIDTATKNAGIKIPYDEVAKHIDDRSSGGAIEQHIAKLRKKSHLSGPRIPLPPRISKRAQRDVNDHMTKSKSTPRKNRPHKNLFVMPDSPEDPSDDSDWEGAMQSKNSRDDHESSQMTFGRKYAEPVLYPPHSAPAVSNGWMLAPDLPDFQTVVTDQDHHDMQNQSTKTEVVPDPQSPLASRSSRVDKIRRDGRNKNRMMGYSYDLGSYASKGQPHWYQDQIPGPMPDAVGLANGSTSNRTLPPPINTEHQVYWQPYSSHGYAVHGHHMSKSDESNGQNTYNSGLATSAMGAIPGADLYDSNPSSSFPSSGGSSFSTMNHFNTSFDGSTAGQINESPLEYHNGQHYLDGAWGSYPGHGSAGLGLQYGNFLLPEEK